MLIGNRQDYHYHYWVVILFICFRIVNYAKCNSRYFQLKSGYHDYLMKSLKATIHLICHFVGNDRRLCCMGTIADPPNDRGWWRWTILHKILHNNMSGICGVRATVGDSVRMADRVADWRRWGVWWPLLSLRKKCSQNSSTLERFWKMLPLWRVELFFPK